MLAVLVVAVAVLVATIVVFLEPLQIQDGHISRTMFWSSCCGSAQSFTASSNSFLPALIVLATPAAFLVSQV